MRVRWNLTSLGRAFARADGFVVSVPKSGRTWLRVLLCAYACERAGAEVRVGTDVLRAHGAPDVRFTHEEWEQRTSRAWDRVRGKHRLAPAERAKPIVLLARDPRDVVVSLHLQYSRRDGRFRGGLSEFLRDPRFGVGAVVDVMNGWWEEWKDAPNAALFRYEDLRARTATELRRVLAHLGFRDVDDAAIAAAVEYAGFENMQRMEREGRFAEGSLRPSDASDPETFKVRRGKIGGYRDYLDAADSRLVDEHCARLAPAFGYATPARDAAPT